MADQFDENGLQIKTLTELRDELTADLKAVYGDDINVDQNSQDGQTINIFSQAARDLREILDLVNAGFDPDQAAGRVLDQRVAINGIARNGGTYTEVPVEITVDKAVNLIGLDGQSAELNPTVSGLYTIKDDAGTRFYLLDSYSFVGAGTQELTFRAAEIGQVEVNINTITTPETVVDGVTGINNPSPVTVEGINEETDADLKNRRRTSQALSSIANINGLQAALADIDGVSVAIVRENDTNVTDGDGTPAHHIWCIVIGGDDTEIAEAIAAKKTHGAGTRGAEVIELLYADNRPFEIKFDRGTPEDLYCEFSISLPNGGVVDTEEIKRLIVENVLFQVGEDATTTAIVGYLYSVNPDFIVTGIGISLTASSYTEVVSPSALNNQLVLDVARITII